MNPEKAFPTTENSEHTEMGRRPDEDRIDPNQSLTWPVRHPVLAGRMGRGVVSLCRAFALVGFRRLQTVARAVAQAATLVAMKGA